MRTANTTSPASSSASWTGPASWTGGASSPGDVLVGLPSSGLHTNGYSLARRVLFDACGFRADSVVPALGTTVGDALLATHRPYLKAMQPLLEAGLVKAMAHITGGGITENLPRALPEGCAADVDPGAWLVPPIFTLIEQRGAIPADEMRRAFNMGVGLIAICAPEDADRALGLLEAAGELGAGCIGRVTAGPRVVRYSS